MMKSLYLCQVVFIFWQLCSRSIHGSENLRVVSGSEYSSLTASLSFAAVYFRKEKSEHHFPDFEDNFNKAAESLESYGITFVKTTCSTGEEQPPCTENNPTSSTVGLFSYGKLVQRLPLEEVFNEDALVAHVLQAVLTPELQLVHSKEDFDSLLDKSKGVSTVILGYVTGFGTTKHRYMMEVSFVYGDNFTFAITTDEKLASSYGMPPSSDGRLWIFFCKEVVNPEEQCKSVQYNGKISVLAMASFIQFQTLPRAVLMPADGVTVYDKMKLPISKVYLFNDEFTATDLSQLNQLSKELTAAVGFVLVNIEEHQSWLPNFGLSAKSQFPAIALVPPSSTVDGIPVTVDVFTDEEMPITFLNVRKLISDFIENPMEFMSKIADSSSLKVMGVPMYKKQVQAGLQAKQNILAGFCLKDYGVCDSFFARDFRRLARTLDKDPRVNVNITFVECTERTCVKDLDIQDFPMLRLHVPGEGGNAEQFFSHQGSMSYHSMLWFIEERLGLENIPQLPRSSSDEVSLIVKKEEVEEEQEEEETKEVEEVPTQPEDEVSKLVQETDSGDENTNVDVPIQEESGAFEGFELPEEEIEDDEVAGSVNKFKTWFIKEEKVPMLTDKSFNVTRNSHDVMVVHFFMPWSSRSAVFKDQYAQVAQRIATDKSLQKKTILAGVNCFDWPDVCQKCSVFQYPSIIMYTSQGNVVYKGPLDDKSIYKTVKLLQYPSDGWSLKSLDEAERCLYDEESLELGDVVLLGLFNKNHKEEMKNFKTASKMMFGKFLVAKATGNIAKEIGKRFDVQPPAIVLVKRNDPLESHVRLTAEFTPENIVQFTITRQLPVFGELTPANLPLYFYGNKPFVIVFRGQKDEMYSPRLRDIAKKRAFPEVHICWINGSESYAVEILKSYTRMTSFPSLVYVDFSKSEVHHYRSSSLDVSDISSWIAHSLSAHNEPTGYLEYGKWKPLMEGYDFLARISGQNTEKSSEEETEENTEQLLELKTNFEEKKRLRKVQPRVNVASQPHHTEL